MLTSNSIFFKIVVVIILIAEFGGFFIIRDGVYNITKWDCKDEIPTGIFLMVIGHILTLLLIWVSW